MGSILVRGSGDIGSAIACRLVQAGNGVLIHDAPAPTATRRGMGFTNATFDSRASLDGIDAVRVDLPDEQDPMSGNVLVSCIPFDELIAAVSPDILVDARMRKRTAPEDMRGLAALTVGLGPGFIAGENCDIAVETSWEDLGRVITEGPTLEFRGEPREIGGRRRERYVYAPVAGRFRTDLDIGDNVAEGQIVATIDGTPLKAPLTGVLRGLTHDGVDVQERTKVIEVDPRGPEAANIYGIAERPGRIAEGVMGAISLGIFACQRSD